jgi:hypothetical protein
MDRPGNKVIRRKKTEEKKGSGEKSPAENAQQMIGCADDALLSPSSAAMRPVALLQFKSEASSVVGAGYSDAFPSPKLSPSQQQALIRHQVRLLDARAHHDQEQFDWKASLRDISPTGWKESRKSHGAGLRLDQQSRGDSTLADSRKSPLSQHVDEIIGAMQTKWTSRGDAVSKRSLSPSGAWYQSPPAREAGNANLTSLANESGINSSRVLDFDTEIISFDASPLKRSVDAAVSANVPEHLPSSHFAAAQHVCFFPHL